MTRYVALLRGVSPMNAKMPALKRCFEAARFTDVTTVLASGNVIFTCRTTSEAAIARRIHAAMAEHLDRTFFTIVRSQADLTTLLASDPYAGHRLPAGAKRVVTFLEANPRGKLTLPGEVDGARIVAVDGRHVFSAYVPGPKGPVFMALIEKTFGKNVTTRTWETVTRCARA